MKRFSFVLTVMAVFFVQGCATHFKEKLPITELNKPENRRTGVPIVIRTNHEEDLRGLDGASVDKAFWEGLDRYLAQGLTNSGFHVVEADDPHRFTMDISCQMSAWNPHPAVFLENPNGGKILMSMPYMLAGGYFGGEGRMSCDVSLADQQSRLINRKYTEDWEDAIAISPIALLYMPFKGAFGVLKKVNGNGADGGKFSEIVAAKLVTNVVSDANRENDLYTSQDDNTPEVVLFLEN